MKKNIYILLALLLGLSLTTCKKDAVPDKLIVNAEVKEVTTNSVIIEGSYEYSMEITEFEMFYSTTDDMNGSQSVKITPEGNDFSVELTDLEDNTQYYFNFVFTGEYNSTTTEEVCDFKTLEVKMPTLTTYNISNINATTAECGGDVTDDGGGTVTERGVCWSTSHYPSVMDNRTKNGGGTGAFTAKMTNLKPNTKYYVRAYATNEKGTNYGVEKGFTTKDIVGLPTVTTKTVSEITATTAKSGGNVIDNGGEAVTERGICWSTSNNPTVVDNRTNNGGGDGDFTAKMTNLTPNTKYYVRAYATNLNGTAYGSQKTFTTLDDGSISVTEPTVTTRNVTAITANSATCGGTVTDEGGATVTARGVCWGISPNPTINNLYDETTVDGDGAGSFISQLTNLKENTTYYVRAYATNNVGTSYGEEFTFTTLQEEGWQDPTGSIDGYDYVELGLPSGLKWATCNIGADSPEGYGNYYAWGEPETKTEYTQDNSLTYGLSISDLQSQGIIDGDYNLTPSHDAATANWGGTWRLPTKAELQELLNNCTWEWTALNGIDGYKVTGPNGNHIFLPAAGRRYGSLLYYAGESGWSSTPYESDSNSAYNLNFSGLQYVSWNSRYYGLSVRPVSGGNNYEPIILLPTVTTTDVTNITSSSATSGGNVTFDGNATVTSRGVCWGTYPNPTINDNKTVDGSSTGSFSSQLTNLAPNTLYYVRAYATNDVGTSYGEQKSFTTLQNIELPTVTTTNVSNITQTTATSGGNVTDDGGATLTARGVCWSTSQNPTISNSHTTDGNGTGSFTSNITGLTANTTYYVRAYATNEKGTAYGEQKSFTTLQNIELPTVTTTNVSNITQTTATSGGNVTDDGGANVTARGVCWSTSQNPTISNSHTTDGNGTGSFTSNMTGLTANTTYYVRAYATNEKGTSYGEQRSFTTLEEVGNYEYVDLGLPSGLKWATCNVGASSPEGYGNYFAWGETETKTEYTYDNSLTFGLSISELQSQGYIDGSGNLTPLHDAATANWGGSWRMPTKEELEELKNECTWTWTTQNGVNGRKVTGPNGNHIFLPAAGRRFGSSLYNAGESGSYWSSTPNESYSSGAYYLYFDSGDQSVDWSNRDYGRSVRPVSE